MATDRLAALHLLLAFAGSIAAGTVSADIRVYTDAQGTLVFTDCEVDAGAGVQTITTANVAPLAAATARDGTTTPPADTRLDERRRRRGGAPDDEAREYMEAYERALAQGSDGH